MTGDFFMKPYISIALIAVSSLWSLDVMAWTCTQKCPSSVFSGKLECKLYQELPKCERERQQRRDEEAKRREDQLSPEEKCQRDASIALAQGQIVICDPSLENIPNVENATEQPRSGKPQPSVPVDPDTLAAIQGQIVLHDEIPEADRRELTRALEKQERELELEKQKAAVPEYKTKEITVEIADGAPQPRFSPIPEGKGWTGKYKIKYRNGAIPTVTFPSYTRDKFNIIDIDKIVVKKLKTERWLLELYYNNSTLPSTQVLKELPAYLKNLPADLR